MLSWSTKMNDHKVTTVMQPTTQTRNRMLSEPLWFFSATPSKRCQYFHFQQQILILPALRLNIIIIHILLFLASVE